MTWDLLDDDALLNVGGQTKASSSDLSEWTKQASSENCHVCDRARKLVCQSCGQGACAAHSWVMLGVCRDCATEDRMKAWKKGRTASSDNWLDGN